MLGLCTSEALVPSSTAFLPRSLRTRGGSATADVRDAVKCLSSTLRAETNGVNGGPERDISIQINGSGLNRNGLKTQKLNGQSLEDIIDTPIPAEFIAETNLPTDVGQYRLRAYRTSKSTNEFTGNEPCVIYSADKPPFGTEGKLLQNVPVRIHDQCLTSEVFRSQR